MGSFAGVNDVLVILKDHGADIDISKKWITIEYEDGFPQSLVITLNAKKGRYLTATPVILRWDRIFVRLTDINGEVVEDVFHVSNIAKKQIPHKGLSLVLTCPHQSSNLWKRTVSFTKTNIKLSNKEALDEMISIINFNKGTSDPTIEIRTPFDDPTKTGNRFDPETANLQVFESIKFNAGVEQLKDKELQPVEGGGSFEPMYVRFKSKYDHATGNFLDTVYLQAFPQGFHDNSGWTNVPTITLKQKPFGTGGGRPSVLGLTSNEDPEAGSNLIAIANKTAGTYLKDYSIYKGAQDVFNNAKAWLDGASYLRGHLVTDVGIFYECLSAHTANSGNRPPSGFWIARTFVKPAQWTQPTGYTAADLVRNNNIAYKALQTHTSSAADEPGLNPGAVDFWVRINYVPPVDYSPLTKNYVQSWINAIAGNIYAATNNERAMVVDANCIINNNLHPRLPVDFVFTDPINIPTELLINGDVPHAFFMLSMDSSDGTEGGTGPFAGNDRNGVPFAGNIVKFHDEDGDGVGEWIVFRETGDDFEVVDWHEGLSWVKNPCDQVTDFVNEVGQCKTIINGTGTRATIWKKGRYNIFTPPGFGNQATWSPNSQFECFHSVKWDSGNGRIDFSTEKILNDDVDSNSAVFAKFTPQLAGPGNNTYFSGLNFHSRWPRTSGSIPFGAVTIGERIKLSVFDLVNMYKTHLGTTDWFGPDVEDFYPIQGWAWKQKFTATSTIFGTFDTVGEYKMSMWLCDERMNVVTIDFSHPRNAETLDMETNLGNKKPYFGVPGLTSFFSAKEPEIVDIFEPHEWLMGGIYTKDSYDEQGRYKHGLSRFLTNSELKTSVDAWRMIKPLVATNLDEPNNLPIRNLETDKIKEQDIVSYSQIKNLVLGLEKFKTFPRRRFIIPTRGRCNIAPGDPIYYENTEVISDTTDAKTNTIKAVADKITYSCSKPRGNGPAGFKRTVDLITRVWP